MATLPSGKEIFLLTDHHSLTNYFSQPTLNARQARWADFLSGFDFEIKHLKGKENRVADALSRKTHCLCELSASKWQSSLIEQIKTAADLNGPVEMKTEIVFLSFFFQVLRSPLPLMINGDEKTTTKQIETVTIPEPENSFF